VRILEFKDYCSGLVLRNRIYLGVMFLLFLALLYTTVTPKIYEAPGTKYLLFAVYKYNYTPEDYRKTFLKWELQSPLLDKEKLIKQVEENRIYSYFRPKRVRKLKNEKGAWLVCGKRVVFTDSPQFQKLKQGYFCARIKNVGGKFFVEEEKWLSVR